MHDSPNLGDYALNTIMASTFLLKQEASFETAPKEEDDKENRENVPRLMEDLKIDEIPSGVKKPKTTRARVSKPRRSRRYNHNGTAPQYRQLLMEIACKPENSASECAIADSDEDEDKPIVARRSRSFQHDILSPNMKSHRKLDYYVIEGGIHVCNKCKHLPAGFIDETNTFKTYGSFYHHYKMDHKEEFNIE